MIEHTSETNQIPARHAGIEALGGMIERNTPLQRPRLGIADGTRNIVNQTLVDLADLRNARRRPLLDRFFVIFESIGPILDEFVIVKILFDNDVRKSKSKRCVGARTNLQEVLGVCSAPCKLGISRDQLAAALHTLDDPMTKITVRIRDNGIVAPDKNIIWPAPIGIIIAIRKELRVVGLEEDTALQVGTKGARNVATLAREKAHGLIGGAEHGSEQRLVNDDVTPGAANYVYAFFAILRLNILDAFLKEIEGVIPTDAFPLVFAAVLTSSFHRIKLSVLVIQRLSQSEAAKAQTPWL